EFLGFLKQLRARYPAGKLYIVCDNYGSHTKAEVIEWCSCRRRHRVVFTPSNASWSNWIECEFTALRYFTLDGSDYPSHAAQEPAIAGYVRWRNKTRTAQARLRSRLQDPTTRLPTQRCLMEH